MGNERRKNYDESVSVACSGEDKRLMERYALDRGTSVSGLLREIFGEWVIAQRRQKERRGWN